MFRRRITRRCANRHGRLRCETLESRHLLTVLLNELNVDPPGIPDKPYEYIELIGTPGEALTDLYFVSVEGDAAEARGMADYVMSLSGYGVGSSGLVIVKSSIGGHTPGAGTTVITDTTLDSGGGGGGGGGGGTGGGQGPIENGTNSFFLIASSMPIAKGVDYDTNDDGVLDNLPAGATIVDSVGWTDGGVGDLVYSSVVLSQPVGMPGAAARFPGNLMPLSADAWYTAALVGSTNSGKVYDSTKASANFPITGALLTPGAANGPTNTPPVVDLNGPAAGLNYTSSFFPLSAGVTIADAANGTIMDTENPVLKSARASLFTRPDGVAESLSANTVGTSISASYNSNNGLLSLTGTDTVAHYQQVLRSITYHNTATSPSTSQRLVSITANDVISDSSIALATIMIGSPNQPPVNTLPSNLATNEDTPLVVSGISITDPDAGSNNVAVTLSVDQGMLNVAMSIPGGAVPGQIAGNNSGSVTITAPLSNITATLSDASGLTFLPASNFNGTALLTVTSNDLGSTGGGGALVDIDTASITVAAINDAPVNTLPASITAGLNTPVAVQGVSIFDVDAGAGDVRVTLNVGSGTLLLSTTVSGGLNGGQVTGNGSATMTITAPLTNINATLANSGGLTFTPATSFLGTTGLTVTSNDQGNSGVGTALTDVDSVVITVSTLNAAPVNTVPAAVTTNENTSVSVSGISITDVDTAGNNVSVTLSSAGGTISLAATVSGGIASGQIAGNQTGTVTITAPLSRINATLTSASGLNFTPTAAFSGTTTLLVTTNDLGNTGFGGAQVDSDAVSIVINAVNDAPVNTLPVSISMNEDTPLALSGVSISDIDAGTSDVMVTLRAQRFRITLATTVANGVTSGQVSGNGTGTVTINAPLSAINAALANANGLTFNPPAEYSGTASFTVTTNDLGNTGAGGAKTDVDSVAFTIAAVNDPPVNTVPTGQSTPQNTPLIFSSVGGNPISISDVDAGANNVQMTLVATNATLLMGTTGIALTGNGSSQVTAVGTLAQLNAALDGLTLTPITDLLGNSAALQVTTNDLGNTGGPTAVDVDTIPVFVAPLPGSPFNVTATTVAVTGTAGVDAAQVVFHTPGLVDVVINGQRGRLAAGSFQNVQIDLASGSDNTIIGNLADANTVAFTPGGLQQTGGGYQIDVTHSELNYAYGDAQDTATFQDSSAVDTFFGSPGNAIMLLGSMTNQAIGFGQIVVNSSAGGADVAILSGSAGADSLTMPAANQVRFAADSSTFTLNQLTQVYVFGGPTDQAHLADSSGTDIFYSLPGYSIMKGVGVYVEPIGFGSVAATAMNGLDFALLYDTAGNDTLTGDTISQTFTGGGSSVTATGFAQTYAFSLSGGADTATLNGTAGNDVFYALNGYSALVAGSMLIEPIGFSQVTVNSGGGSDSAVFADSPGDETLTASPTATSIVGTNRQDTANGFTNIYAYATAGGNDTANLDGSAGDDIFAGNANDAALFQSNVYLLQVFAFDLVHASLTGGGNDIALLLDGAGNDTLNAAGNTAELLYSTGPRIQLAAFDTVYARGTSGGTNTRNTTNPLAYSLVFEGTWA